MSAPRPSSSGPRGSTQGQNVTLVGRLITPSATGNSYRFVLDDGTGRIVCTYWFAGHGGDNRVMNIPVGDYVDVSGRPDMNSNNPTITVFSCSDEGLPFSWICTGTSFNHVIVRRALDILVSRELAIYDPVEDKYSLP
ncbi:hypothetical protein VPH35_033999 [Triticum aestivum]